MKKLLLLFLLFLSVKTFSQQVNGVIVSDTGNIIVVKVWGTHYERGFATGYLLAEHIVDIYVNYIKPAFGSLLPTAKTVIQQGIHIRIDSVYHVEAQGVYDGVDSAGYSASGMDYIDVLVANAFLDLQGLYMFKEVKLKMGCSSLMDWGTATAGTDLDGKSVIARHLDWSNVAAVVNNQAVIIHFPSETDEQPWAMIGFAGQMSALSGINNDGLGVFQHMMSDFSGTALMNMGYEPVWFSMRKALEKKDFNNDGLHDMSDIKDAIAANANGYADGYIITALAPSATGFDSLTAMVAEVAPSAPLITFRTNTYPDSIPDDNLYAANYEIKRNNHLHFCSRYYRTKNGLSDGTFISSADNWQIMRDSSNSGTGNIQFMQFIPEWRQLKLSVYKSSLPAYLYSPGIYYLDDLFNNTVIITGSDDENIFQVFPNPASDKIFVKVDLAKHTHVNVSLYSISGNKHIQFVDEIIPPGDNIYSIDVSKLLNGIYICHISYDNINEEMKLLISH
ncbi:MAG: T9SS type A sorting domain-containing protein [Bacteroidota bacterium]